jgi:hypothetical protein
VTLTEFLTARLDEDEAVARKASHQKVAGPFHGDWRADSLALSVVADREDRRHIARHDPARVLAEVAAKRAIVELHKVMPWRLSTVGYVQGHDGRRWAQHYYGGCCSLCTAGGEYGGNVAEFDTDEPDYCDTLRHLAAVYADHQDFREEWRV